MTKITKTALKTMHLQAMYLAARPELFRQLKPTASSHNTTLISASDSGVNLSERGAVPIEATKPTMVAEEKTKTPIDYSIFSAWASAKRSGDKGTSQIQIEVEEACPPEFAALYRRPDSEADFGERGRITREATKPPIDYRKFYDWEVARRGGSESDSQAHSEAIEVHGPKVAAFLLKPDI